MNGVMRNNSGSDSSDYEEAIVKGGEEGCNKDDEDYNSDDFVDAFDNQRDLDYFIKKTGGDLNSLAEAKLGEEDDNYNYMNNHDGIRRRTASFSNIIQEENVDEEEDEIGASEGSSGENT